MSKPKDKTTDKITTASSTAQCDRFFSICFEDMDGVDHVATLDPDEASALRDRIDEALNTTGP